MNPIDLTATWILAVFGYPVFMTLVLRGLGADTEDADFPHLLAAVFFLAIWVAICVKWLF